MIKRKESGRLYMVSTAWCKLYCANFRKSIISRPPVKGRVCEIKKMWSLMSFGMLTNAESVYPKRPHLLRMHILIFACDQVVFFCYDRLPYLTDLGYFISLEAHSCLRWGSHRLYLIYNSIICSSYHTIRCRVIYHRAHSHV